MMNRKNLWSKGKEETKKFYEIKLNRSTNIITFIFGLVVTVIIIFPFAALLLEILEINWYKPQAIITFLSFAWGLLMISNGLSNFFTVKLAKCYARDMLELQAIDEYAILFYQCLNIGFGIFILAILLFFGLTR
ncbi:MAG TPA: hypothetical protein PKG96_01335 [Bacilli bacterium]|jgi:hypothetical protein|nr:hypothetical protein [Bacilli bacterium]HNZ77709.1 hypothetical protein [Bacilli bacterium]HOD60740.1 hypothetical protein [Bacilli bacterium]HOR17601.1 hypothetical protein [Bacilli bacterium]HPM15473.1 hypothetical protein [Bacilli bacterium]